MGTINNIEYLEVNPTNFCGIYCLYCLITKKFYIGSAEIFQRRKLDHLNKLNKNKHTNEYLQSSWNKYGSNNFVWLKIETVDNKDVILQREQYYYLDLYKPYDRTIGYNLNNIAGRPPNLKGLKRPKEFCENITRLKTGFKYSAETKLKQRNAKLGKKLSKEHSLKISLALKKKGHKPNKLALENVSKANAKIYFLLSPSDEVIKITNLSKFCKERQLTADHMRNVYFGRYGKNNYYKGWRNVQDYEICI